MSGRLQEISNPAFFAQSNCYRYNRCSYYRTQISLYRNDLNYFSSRMPLPFQDKSQVAGQLTRACFNLPLPTLLTPDYPNLPLFTLTFPFLP